MGPAGRAFHHVKNFDEVADVLPLSDDDWQAILDAYAKLDIEVADIADVARSSKMGEIAYNINVGDCSKAVCNKVWKELGREVGEVGFLRLHAALLVGGHSEKFARNTPAAGIVADSIVPRAAIDEMKAKKVVK